MNALLLLLALAPTQVNAENDVDAAQFLQLIRSLHDQIRDVSFVFEGELRYVGRDEATKEELAAFEERFQGTLTCKSNEDFIMEIYHNRYRRNEFARNTTAVSKGRAFAVSDRDPRRVEIVGKPGGLRGIFEFGYPFTYYVAPNMRLFKAPTDFTYEFNGWQEIDGHRCLVVTIYEIPGNKTFKKRYWFDMGRGGHPLRTEAFRDDKLNGGVTEVELKEFRGGDGKTIWFPVRATHNLYTWNGKRYKSPTIAITNHVLETSFRVNQGIADSDVDIKKRAVDSHPRGISREWLELAESSRRPKPRTDPEGVKKRLDKLLAEADRQSRLINASASARAETSWTSYIRAGFFVLGAGLLAGAVIWRRRRL